MVKNIKLFLVIYGIVLLLPAFTFANTAAKDVVSSPAPWLDDANLHAVQFVGTTTGWAVGDRGVIWKTTDAGEQWKLLPSPVKSSLKSICFLSDQVGWIAGGSTEEFTQLSKGVILFTNDGGKTWSQPAKAILPMLYKIKFFSLKDGIAVGGASVKQHSSVYTTDDGGVTWTVVPGEQISKWRVADFLSSRNGIVAGRAGNVALVGNGRVLKSTLPGLGNRGLNGVKLNRDLSGWLVGDGGLLLKTKNGGIEWNRPFNNSFSNKVRELFDFQTVTSYGKHVWVAGQPGSIIWHSNDEGLNWQPQKTKQTLPIHSLHFANERQGWAVGAMGMILKTNDGGQSWKSIRGGNRRVAIMGIYSNPQNLSCPLVTQLSGEEGYRSVAFLPLHNRTTSASKNETDLDQHWHDAMLRAGGNGGQIGWQFDVESPEIELEKTKLISQLQRKSEGQFGQKFIEYLVRQIRQWQPSVIVLHHQNANNKLDELLLQAVTKATGDAADSTRFLLHHEAAGLSTWKVKRIFVRGKDGHRSALVIDPNKYLPHLRAINQTISVPAYGMLAPLQRQTTLRETYAQISDAGKETFIGKNFFAGIALQPGSSARRKLLPIDADDLEKQLRLAQKQRHFKGVMERYLDHPQHSAQIISQLNTITKGMSDEQAALQLASLGHDYIQKNRWELAEATYINLVERYPHQPVTAIAERWLFQFWGSAETTWQRVRQVTVKQKQLAGNVEQLREQMKQANERRLQQAIAAAQISPLERPAYNPNAAPDPVSMIKKTGGLSINTNKTMRSGKIELWQKQAIQLASLMRHRSPQLFESAEVQFPLAALMRQRGSTSLANRYHQRFQNSGKEGRWKKIADSEMWLTTSFGEPPQKSLLCHRTTTRPKLDGMLSDSCWEAAGVMKLTSKKEGEESDDQPNKKEAFTMFAYDKEFLYIAASFPKHAQLNYKPIKQSGRTHDADLRGHDRISLKIDIDRDYTTWYEMQIDQRGQTAEACFGNKKWNPKWYVATKEDQTHWRIEAAIPFAELSPTPPARGSIWAVNITRILPAVGYQSWTKQTKDGDDTFGYLRFR